MIELLQQLCALNGVSGDEDQVRQFIQEQAAPYAHAIRTDALGNLLVFKKGAACTGSRFLLAAHMDEVGVIVTSIAKEGFLKFDFVGGVDRRVALGKRVALGRDSIPGIIGLKAVHLVEREDAKKPPKVDSLYIDIGAKDQASAQALVQPGTYGAFVGEPELFGDGMLKAKAIDDRVGCAVMLELLKEDLPLDVTFAFTAQEELGSRGAFGAAFSVVPDLALILEGTFAADLAEIKAHKSVCALGKGPVISYLDGSSIYDRSLFEGLRGLAQQNGIRWQCKAQASGGNDAEAFQRSRSGTRVAALSAPVRYLHAPSSVGCVADFDDMLRLTRLFLTRAATILGEEET